MRIILTSIGTRGDMEPFLAIGEMFKNKGHDVICLFPEQFRELAIDTGLQFESLGSEFIEMLDSPSGRLAMSGGRFGFKKMMAYLKLINMQKSINKKMVDKQENFINNYKPDRIVHNGKVVYPVVWSINNKNKTVLINPVPYMHYVKNHSHIAFGKNYGEFINKLTYDLANYGLIKTISSSFKHLNVGAKDIKKALFGNKTIYTISPTLFNRPEYWTKNLQVLGYHERKKSNNWTPPEDMLSFINQHQKIVFITFGSMINNNPEEKTRVILDILERNSIPAIINTASGGLVKPKIYDKNLLYFTNKIPYDYIFPKMYAIIHHGGSGTTHSALKYGCASLIIPHIIDQYAWNKISYEKGAGPFGDDINKIRVDNLEPKILDLINNKKYKSKAEELGKQISSESLEKELYQSILS